MGGDPLSDARALAALGVLLLLPGLTVVRAPWTAVPFLSLSFWLVSWCWLEPLGATRERFVVGALLFFATLAALRLLKPLPRARPGWPARLVALAALGQLAPLAWLGLPPGDDGPLRALTVRLLVWRDGLPRTYEPLAPVHSFGAALQGADLLAADLALLSGAAPQRAALVAALATHGLLLVALQALLVRALLRAPAEPSAAQPGAGLAPGGAARAQARGAAAVGVLAVAGLSGAISGGLPHVVPAVWLAAAWPSTLLGLPLLVSAVALLLRGRDRAPAVAAGLFLGAALVSEPLLLALALPAAALAAVAWLSRARASGRRAQAVRLALAEALAAGLSAPALLRLDFTLSPSERAALGPLVVTAAHLLALGSVAVAAGLALVLAAATARHSDRARALADARLMPWRAPLALAAGFAALGTAWGAARLHPRTPPTAADLSAMRILAARTSVTDFVCGDPSTPDVWIPALAGRGVQPAPLPGFYAEELAAGFQRRPCRVQTPGTGSSTRRQSLEKP